MIHHQPCLAVSRSSTFFLPAKKTIINVTNKPDTITGKPMNRIILENHRALLRPLCADDEALLLPFSLNEPETWRYSPSGAAGQEALHAYIAKALTEKTAGIAYPFVVIDKNSNTIAGSSRYYNINLKNRNLEIGFTWYGQTFRGTGLNKHCKFLLLEHAFETMNCLRVGFKADATNTVSVAAMKSIGAQEEGILRQDTLMPDGRFRDTMVLSILQKEWNEYAKADLQRKLA
jgi:RimJ/RimL family protein N-acetyltransferase